VNHECQNFNRFETEYLATEYKGVNDTFAAEAYISTVGRRGYLFRVQ